MSVEIKMKTIDKSTTHVRVMLPKSALLAVFDECDRYDSDETGGRLLGVYRKNGSELEIDVTGIIEPGPNARRTATSFFQDGDYQAQVFRTLESRQPEIEHLGNWHTHHVNGYPTLSSGDRATYHRIVDHRKHNTDFFYALLVVTRKADAKELDRYEIRHYLLRRGDGAVYEIPAADVEIIDRACIWPESSRIEQQLTPPTNTKAMRAQDQMIFHALYPEMQPFISNRTHAMTWKGRLTLVDDSAVDVRVVELEDDDYRALIKHAPEECAAVVAEIAESPHRSAARALRHAEHVLNRNLHGSRDET